MPVEFATPLRYRFASLGICLRRALFLQAYAVTVKEFQALLEGRDPYPWQPHEDRWTLSCSHQPVVGQPAKTSGSPAFPGTYVKWREELNALLDKAGVKMTPHGFRHFRISEWLAQGITPTDVSKMVGTCEKEIRKTYEHWIKEAEDRLDEIQRQSWLKQGLNENGDAKEGLIQ